MKHPAPHEKLGAPALDQSREDGRSAVALRPVRDRWLLSAIVESSEDAILSKDLNGAITTWNKAAERIFGYQASEVIGKSITLLLPSDRLPEESMFLERLKRGERIHNFETVRVRKDGTQVPVSLTISPVRDGAGHIIGASKIAQDITERKRTEEALARSEQQARLIADATPALISYIDARLCYRFVNREYELWFDRPRDAILDKPMTEVLGEAAVARLRPYIDAALAGREVHFETQVPFLEDGTRWVEAHYVPDRDGEGKVVGFYVMILDMTKRRQMEQALRESEQRLRATFERAAVGIVELDANDRLIAVNDRLCQILGYRREELLGMTIHELTAPEDRAISHELNAQLHQRRLETFSYEKRYLKRDGSPLWVHVAVSAVRDLEGRSLRHIGTVEDITERKRAEQALRESEERHRTITEAMPHLVWSTGADGALEYINGKWTEYTGLSLYQSVGNGWVEAVCPDDAPRVVALWREAIASQTVFNCDYRLRGKDGAYRWFKSWGVPLHDAEGKVVNWFGACTDIDDVVKAREVLARDRDALERTVQDRTAKLQEMVAELETFSYSIAHDMRGPLRAMQGFADAVLEDYGEHVGPEGKDYLQRIKAAAARQDHFIRDVLNYSRLVRQELALEPVNLDQLVPGVILEYPNLQAARDCIEVRLPLGAVIGHGPSLVQCVSNLLGNALKFVAPDTVPQVKVWTEQRGDHVRLWVQDNGLGIAPEHHGRIFRLFERLHGQADYPGTGIGLAVVRKAAERIGGTVGLESQLGQGSRFWIELKSAG